MLFPAGGIHREVAAESSGGSSAANAEGSIASRPADRGGDLTGCRRGALYQAEKMDVLKQALPMFARMRSLAMRFRGLLCGRRAPPLDAWIRDAMTSGLTTMRIFAGKLRHDIDAVRNAIREQWSNGQTEGQVNRLKALKRTLFGRASVRLLCARMQPLNEFAQH